MQINPDKYKPINDYFLKEFIIASKLFCYKYYTFSIKIFNNKCFAYLFNLFL